MNISIKFPKLLDTAKVKGRRVLWAAHPDLLDDEIMAYNDWKSSLGIDVLTAHKLKKLHSQGQYVHEIFKLFKNSNKIKYLEQNIQNKKV